MKLNRFYLLCLTAGLVPVAILQTVPDQYIFRMSAVEWPMAQNYCRVMYYDMASIKSDTDMLRFNKEAASKGLKEPAWIGLHNDIDTWRWSLNELYLKNALYKNWGSAQPDNNGGKEACGLIDANALWWDANCTVQKPFVCYDDKFSDAARFIAFSSPMLNWTEAQAYCRIHHTDLASSLNSSDNNIIKQKIQTFKIYPWFGLYRDTWKWPDGTIATNLPWISGQPDNYGGNQKCAVIYNGLLNDVPCTKLYYFVCQTLIKQQIVRLEVKSDVFIPDVQSSIIEKIKQKLNEHGMLGNITVTWRVQPDGNIFHEKNNDDL